MAGGIYSGGTCHPAAQSALGERCAARGGTHVAGGDYCEVPPGGLRPM